MEGGGIGKLQTRDMLVDELLRSFAKRGLRDIFNSAAPGSNRRECESGHFMDTTRSVN